MKGKATCNWPQICVLDCFVLLYKKRNITYTVLWHFFKLTHVKKKIHFYLWGHHIWALFSSSVSTTTGRCSLLYCIILYCTVLYSTILYCTAHHSAVSSCRDGGQGLMGVNGGGINMAENGKGGIIKKLIQHFLYVTNINN